MNSQPPHIRLIPLRHTTKSEMTSALAACTDAMNDPAATRHMWHTRWEHAQHTPGPQYWATTLIFDAHGPAGWSGWVPYQETPNTWQTSTWLSPRLRGHGLLPILRCDQIHRGAALVHRWQLEDPTWISSIETTNHRSLAASRRYAHQVGWTTWHQTHEPVRQRDAWILTWPQLPATHPCHQPRRPRPHAHLH